MKEIERLQELGIDNPYLRLGIKESATREEILSTFRSLVKRYGSDPDRKVDNQYVMEILKAARDALVNPESRVIIDSVISKKKEGHELQTVSKTKSETNSQGNSDNRDISIEEVLKNVPVGSQKKIRTHDLLPEIVDDLGIAPGEDISFADIQLILRQYLKRSWESYPRPDVSDWSYRDFYLLLDKKGSLTAVRTEDTFFTESLTNVFTGQEICSCKPGDLWKLETKERWRRQLPSDERLISVDSVFPPQITYNEWVSANDIIKGLELGNECLFRLRKNGYLKKNSAKEYIR